MNLEEEVIKKTRKRKLKDIESDEEEEDEDGGIIKEFKNEDKIKSLYSDMNGTKVIVPESSFFVAIDTKNLLKSLDLKKEVVLTMLNQLQACETPFYKLHSNLNIGLQIRFHSKSLEQLAEGESANSKFYKVFLEIATSRQGCYRCNMMDLARRLGLKPYKLTRVLYQLQHFSGDEIAYDLDHESFILEIYHIPHNS